MLEGMSVNVERMRRHAEAGFAAATDVADYLAAKGVPFREAHAVVGRLVLHCIQTDKTLSGLSLEQYQSFHPSFEADIHARIEIEAVADARDVRGGTARKRVLKSLKQKKEQLGETQAWLDTV
jgi:argininosuccinate lyase